MSLMAMIFTDKNVIEKEAICLPVKRVYASI